MDRVIKMRSYYRESISHSEYEDRTNAIVLVSGKFIDNKDQYTYIRICGRSGGIGRRARLKIWWTLRP